MPLSHFYKKIYITIFSKNGKKEGNLRLRALVFLCSYNCTRKLIKTLLDIWTVRQQNCVEHIELVEQGGKTQLPL
jgi:hypothetical protein